MKNRNAVRCLAVASVLLLFNMLHPAYAQDGVRIAASAGTADPSAMLDVVSSNKGLLVPRVNLVGLTNGSSPIASPATGLLVYNLGGGGVPATGFYYWTGSAWVQLTSGGFSGAGTVNFVTKWTASNALGNSVIYDNGTNVGVGTTSPSAKLDAAGSIKASGGGLISEVSSNEGGSLTLSNPSKTGANAGQWILYNMTGGYGNSFQIWSYPTGSIPSCCIPRFRINDDGNTILVPSGGSVGIGTTPSAKLHIAGTAGVDGLMFPDNTLQKTAATTTFTNWGRSDCPGSSSVVYSGYAAGAHYQHGGSGANTLCLTGSPSWSGATFSDASQNGGLVYGLEYEFSGYGLGTLGSGIAASSYQNYNAVCAVCLVQGHSVSLMIPGTNACPSGWTQQYWGYLVSTYYGQAKSEFVCMINNPVQSGSNADHNGNLWYPVEAELGSLTSPYVQDRELTCTVCTK